jgi:hypothetical protein
MSGHKGEGYRWLRLMMVLSSFAPLFIFWAVRGQSLMPEWWFLISCAALAVLPTAFTLLRVRAARAAQAETIDIGPADDRRDDLLVYLFAMLLPFYAPDLSTWRSLAAVILALAFVVFLFWYLDLHYVNVLFAAMRYRVFVVRPNATANPSSGDQPLVIITKRHTLDGVTSLEAIQLSDTVFLEEGEAT